jgi:hypothetical protein
MEWRDAFGAYLEDIINVFCVFFLFFLSSDIIIIVHMYNFFKQAEVVVGDKKMRRTEGGANICGVFRVKNNDFTPTNHILFQF